MSFYLDTNIVVSLFFDDAHSATVDGWLAATARNLVLSYWTETEFAAIVLRRARMGEISLAQAAEILGDFDAWALSKTTRLDVSHRAGEICSKLSRDPPLKLSAADALHLGLSVDGDLTLVTLDRRLAEAAILRNHSVEVPGGP